MSYYNMPVPIFDQPVDQPINKPEKKPEQKEKASSWVIFFAGLLVLVLIILSDFAFRDINKLVNPYYGGCQIESKVSLTYPYIVQRGAIDEEVCPLEKYERARLILHADLAVPLILFSMLAYVIIRNRKFKAAGKTLVYSSIIFIIYVSLRIIGEGHYYFIKHHPLLGKYLLLLTVVIILIILMLYIQKKIRQNLPKKPPKKKLTNSID